jgi:bacillithiol system protein YtxJ
MEPNQIREKADLDAATSSGLYLLFKHSPVCPVSARAFEEYRAFAAGRDDVPTGWIDVIGQRPWSREVAEKTGVTHQSPQALLFRDGEVVWHASHGAITKSTLAEAAPRA